MKIKLLFLSTLLAFSACYYNNKEELLGVTTCDTSSVKYSTDIKPILTSNCLGCHGTAIAAANGGDIDLENYNQLKLYSDPDGAFLGSVKWTTGFSKMPKGGSQLTDCDIKKIEKWVADGAPNN